MWADGVWNENQRQNYRASVCDQWDPEMEYRKKMWGSIKEDTRPDNWKMGWEKRRSTSVYSAPEGIPQSIKGKVF